MFRFESDYTNPSPLSISGPHLHLILPLQGAFCCNGAPRAKSTGKSVPWNPIVTKCCYADVFSSYVIKQLRTCRIHLRRLHFISSNCVFNGCTRTKTTPTRNDCIAWLGSMVGSWAQVPARVDLRRTNYIQWGQAWLLKGYKAGLPYNCCRSVGLNRRAVNALRALLWQYMRIPYSRVQGSGYNACTGKYCIICPGPKKKKFLETNLCTLYFYVFIFSPI
jgi:hypothetical protein